MSRCKTINLANMSVEQLVKCKTKLPHTKPARFQECQMAEMIPPPPRLIKSPKIQICRPRGVDFVQPPVPCICPPCPTCPSSGERFRSFATVAFKVGILYWLFETLSKEDIWGSADGTSNAYAKLHSLYSSLYQKEEGQNTVQSRPIGIIEPDKILYTLAKWWDKAVIFTFTWSVGIPLQLAHDTYDMIEYKLFGDDDLEEFPEANVMKQKQNGTVKR